MRFIKKLYEDMQGGFYHDGHDLDYDRWEGNLSVYCWDHHIEVCPICFKEMKQTKNDVWLYTCEHEHDYNDYYDYQTGSAWEDIVNATKHY